MNTCPGVKFFFSVVYQDRRGGGFAELRVTYRSANPPSLGTGFYPFSISIYFYIHRLSVDQDEYFTFSHTVNLNARFVGRSRGVVFGDFESKGVCVD